MNRVSSSNSVPLVEVKPAPAVEQHQGDTDPQGHTVSHRQLGTENIGAQSPEKTHSSPSEKCLTTESSPRASDLKNCTVAALSDIDSMSEIALKGYCQQLHKELGECCLLLGSLKQVLDYAVDLRPFHRLAKDPQLIEYLEIKESQTINYENGLYTGQSILGKANGQGSCVFNDGSRYTGEWKNNHMHGIGIINFPSGEYKGQFESGQYSGEGEYAYHHGQRYRGNYKQGQRHGHGVLKLSEESAAGYVGEWIEGKRNGYGIQIFPDGDQYYGEWAEDRWHGKGVKVEHSKEVIHLGKWEFNQFHGTIHTYKLADTKDYYRGKMITR
jgi:hypothetical protein